ncbi:MAG TPA: CPBP family intramembrane glutamic endopeptidase [Candidatus Acidoferrales bacterium]|nr:CPBP family intramembrane glutamic endopeptidase [Candidatus Acidoferrales bacterium]
MTFADPENPLPPSDSPSPELSSPVFLPPPPPSRLELENARSPEDIRTPWGGGELVVFVGFAFLSLVVLEVILVAFLVMRYRMTSGQLMQLMKTDAAFAVGFQTLWSVFVLLFLLLMVRVYHRAPFWRSLGWRRFDSRQIPSVGQAILCILGGIGLAIIVGVVSEFVGNKNNLPIDQLFQTRTNVLWLMVFGIAFAPFFEETIFRGYLYPVFARKWGIPAGIVITGILFGLMHAAQLWGGWAQIAILIFVGIALTFARARARSVLASFLIHVTYNSFLFAAFFLGTHGLQHIPH